MPCAGAAASARVRRSPPVRGPGCAIFRRAPGRGVSSWAWARSKRSSERSVVVPAVRPAAPRAPVPVVHRHLVGGHRLLVGQALLEHVLAVGGVGVLVADVQADAHGGIGIDVEHATVADLARELVRRQLRELGLALGRIGGHELETGSSQHVFLVGDLLLRALAGGGGNNAQSQSGQGRPNAVHLCSPRLTCFGVFRCPSSSAPAFPGKPPFPRGNPGYRRPTAGDRRYSPRPAEPAAGAGPPWSRAASRAHGRPASEPAPRPGPAGLADRAGPRSPGRSPPPSARRPAWPAAAFP